MSSSSNEDRSGANPFETSEDVSAEMKSLISTSTNSNNPSAPDEFQDDSNYHNNNSNASESESEPSSHRSRATTINMRCRGMSVYDKNSLYPVDLEAEIQASHQDHLQFDDKKLYTELLCLRSNLDSYIKITDQSPEKGEGTLRFLASKWFSCCSKNGGGGKTDKKMTRKNRAMTTILGPEDAFSPMKYDQWHACARWHKFLEVLENEGQRWSHPQVTTLCPYYIQTLRDNLSIFDTLESLINNAENETLKESYSQFIRTISPNNTDEIYQSIYLSDFGDDDLPVAIKFIPKDLKWIVENGLPHDRFEVGRSIGGIFSCQEYKMALGDTHISHIQAVIDSFLHHSTLVPFNSWDPRFRITPPNISNNPDEIPNWLDPNLEKLTKAEREEAIIKGSLWIDIKNKFYPFLTTYLGDYTNGFNIQCFSCIIFMYFVNITPIVTFGAINQDETNGAIGTIESLIGSAICGISFSMFAGQPLVMISQTGPMLVFDRILVNLCKKLEVDFLVFRLCVGLWTCCFLLILVFTRASKLVKYITNFTEESFSSLISLIFIVDGIKRY